MAKVGVIMLDNTTVVGDIELDDAVASVTTASLYSGAMSDFPGVPGIGGAAPRFGHGGDGRGRGGGGGGGGGGRHLGRGGGDRHGGHEPDPDKPGRSSGGGTKHSRGRDGGGGDTPNRGAHAPHRGPIAGRHVADPEKRAARDDPPKRQGRAVDSPKPGVAEDDPILAPGAASADPSKPQVVEDDPAKHAAQDDPEKAYETEDPSKPRYDIADPRKPAGGRSQAGTTDGGRTPSSIPHDVDSALRDAAEHSGLDINYLRSVASIESSMDPGSNRNAGTQYKGLFQLGTEEWNKYGAGDKYNAHDNAMAAARMMKDQRADFIARFGRSPTDAEQYMIHQQGMGFHTRGAMTNIGGNPYPGMRGPQSHESFQSGWGSEIEKRKQRYAQASGGGVATSGAAVGAGVSSDGLPANILATARRVAVESGGRGVSEFMRSMGHPKNDAWCGDFAAAVVEAAGGHSPANPEVASNWRRWGTHTDNPVPGDIASRLGTPIGSISPHGHVTIYEGPGSSPGTFRALGGNQGAFEKDLPAARYEFRHGGGDATRRIADDLFSLSGIHDRVYGGAATSATSVADKEQVRKAIENYHKINPAGTYNQSAVPAGGSQGGILHSLHLPRPPSPPGQSDYDVRINAPQNTYTILRSPGGNVGEFMKFYSDLAKTGADVVLAGPIYSAGTLATGMLPLGSISVTPRASLGFHAAFTVNPKTGEHHTSPSSTKLLMDIYPKPIQTWINARGGLTPSMKYLQGQDLKIMYPSTPGEPVPHPFIPVGGRWPRKDWYEMK